MTPLRAFHNREVVMRLNLLVCCPVLIGCVTANGPGGGGSGESVHIAGPAGQLTAEIHPVNDAIGGAVPFTIERAWAAVRAAYDSLALPVATFDPASHTIASPTLRLRRRLGETQLSKYLNCGDAQGGRSADSYEIQLTVQTTLQAVDAGTTRVMTTLSAEGRPITLSGDYSRCSSTGGLERRLVALVNDHLNR